MSYCELIKRHNFTPETGILPGFGWLDQHEHDLDGWEPRFETSGPGFRHSMTIKPGHENVVSKIMKINKRR